MKTSIYLIILIFTLLGCGSDSEKVIKAVFSPNEYKHDPQFYFQSAGTVKLNVFYFESSVPFTGQDIKDNIDYWDITKENLKSIFQYKSFETELIIPNSLDEMKSLGATTERMWTFEKMELLAKDYSLKDTPTTANFNIFFVPGNFVKSKDRVQEQVIGLNLSKTNIIFIFHDIVTSSTSLQLQVFMEQSTLVHELGHVLGFVNNGVPPVSDHQDINHGNHTTNKKCVMYHSNEGAGKLKTFVDKYIKTKDLTMWGPEILEDAEEFSR